MATTSTARSFSKERHEHRRRRDHLHGTTIHAQHQLRVPGLGSRCRRTPSSQGGRHPRAAHACARIAVLAEQARTPTCTSHTMTNNMKSDFRTTSRTTEGRQRKRRQEGRVHVPQSRAESRAEQSGQTHRAEQSREQSRAGSKQSGQSRDPEDREQGRAGRRRAGSGTTRSESKVASEGLETR